MEENIRKPGEMFTSSVLKKITPLHQFLFSLTVGILFILFSQFILHSQEMVLYSGCFAVVFYIMFNPWLCVLSVNMKLYLISSWILYFLLALLVYGLVYLLTGLGLHNSFEVKLILITTTFYMIVADGMMSILKMFFLDVSDGGL